MARARAAVCGAAAEASPLAAARKHGYRRASHERNGGQRSRLMALQDLTPQLRTRLSRLERVVGIFVVVATLLLLAGLAYYVYSTARARAGSSGNFRISLRAQRHGLQVGDPIRLMGFPAGRIIEIQLQPLRGSIWRCLCAVRNRGAV